MCGVPPGMTLTCSTLQFGSAGSPLEENELAKLIFLQFDEFDLTLHDFDEFDLTLHDFDEFDLAFGVIEIDGAVRPGKIHSLEHISVQPAARRSKHIKFSRRRRLDGVRLQNPCSTKPVARETSVTLHQSRCQRLLGLKSMLDKRRLQRISRKCNELCPQ